MNRMSVRFGADDGGRFRHHFKDRSRAFLRGQIGAALRELLHGPAGIIKNLK